MRRSLFLSGSALCGMLAAVALSAPDAEATVYQKVDVQGARLIPAEDIRKACGPLTGVDLDDTQRHAVETCLMYSGAFEKVSVRGEGDTLVIAVTEAEDHPGRIDAGLMYDSDFGLTAVLSYRQFNLIPDTQTRFSFEYSEEVHTLDAGLYRQNAFGKAFGLGLDLSAERTEYDNQSFRTRREQGETFLTWMPQKAARLRFGLGYRSHKRFGVDEDASALIRQEPGKEEAPFLHLAYGQRIASGPRDYWMNADQYFWNLGTSDTLSDSRFEIRMRQNFAGGTELLLGLRGGVVRGISGNDTTVLDRFFVGGQGFRGFEPRGIGPADGSDLVGANRYLVGSVEARRPIGSWFGEEFTAGVFSDFGSAWSLDNTLGGSIDDSAHLRVSVGLSLNFKVGVAPVSLYLAKPVEEESQDRDQLFGLRVTARF